MPIPPLTPSFNVNSSKRVYRLSLHLEMLRSPLTMILNYSFQLGLNTPFMAPATIPKSPLQIVLSQNKAQKSNSFLNLLSSAHPISKNSATFLKGKQQKINVHNKKHVTSFSNSSVIVKVIFQRMIPLCKCWTHLRKRLTLLINVCRNLLKIMMKLIKRGIFLSPLLFQADSFFLLFTDFTFSIQYMPFHLITLSGYLGNVLVSSKVIRIKEMIGSPDHLN